MKRPLLRSGTGVLLSERGNYRVRGMNANLGRFCRGNADRADLNRLRNLHDFFFEKSS